MVKSEKDFVQLQKRALNEWTELAEGSKPVFMIGTATCGISAGSLEIVQTLKETIAKNDIDARVVEVGCIGLCFAEPMVTLLRPSQPAIVYGYLSPEKTEELVKASVSERSPLADLALGSIGDQVLEGIQPFYDSMVLKPQVRRILKKCGEIDPNNILHYIAHQGYSGVMNALHSTPETIVEEVKKAGLRGRGGAGFPTGIKWNFALKQKSDKKYIVCNADEGDPGAFMNRSVLESDPHALIEGMLIAGYTIGASEGYIYCRAEYPLALERLRLAITQTEEYGFIGSNIMGSTFNFHIKIKEGAGAFVCGEETALLASIEGRRGMPSTRPPYPAVSGLWGKPTIINNVETLASISLIFQNDAQWFSQYGSGTSMGTKTFALAGKVQNTGLIEVPLGITLREIIFDIGGGPPEERKFKAVQTGGPSGGCIPESLLDTPIDYDSLKKAGAIMGSGGMIVMDDRTCMVDVARYFLDFTQKESCGECVPCRLGTKQTLKFWKIWRME
jgi:NADH-quinone oxidoreductase subunit F